MAMSHTGALAGSDTGFTAMCRRYNVILVDDLDELAAMLLCLDQRRPFGPGGLASIHDSGGERELVVDLAERFGVDFAEISAATKAKLAAELDPGLVAENPVDAWGTAKDFVDRYTRIFDALVADHIERRLLKPERLQDILSTVLNRREELLIEIFRLLPRDKHLCFVAQPPAAR